MRRVLVFVVLALVPVAALASLVAAYALWVTSVTPAWSHRKLTIADLQRPAIKEADLECRSHTGLGLMATPTLSRDFRFNRLTEIQWSNGDVSITMTTAPVAPTDKRGVLHPYSRRFFPPKGLPVIMSIPGNSLVVLLARTPQGLQMTQMMATSLNSILGHQPGVVIVRVVEFEIGELNRGAVAPSPHNPKPSNSAPPGTQAP